MEILIGLLYDALFVLLLWLMAKSGQRKGFVSTLLSLSGTLIGILSGVVVSRAVAPALYRDVIGVAIGERIRESVAGYGSNLSAAVAELSFLPASFRTLLLTALRSATGDVVPRIVDALEPLFLPMLQALVFVVVCLVVRLLVGVLARMMRGINAVPLVGDLNKLLGFLMGLVSGALDCWLLAMALWALSGFAVGRFPFLAPDLLARSAVYRLLGNFNPFIV